MEIKANCHECVIVDGLYSTNCLTYLFHFTPSNVLHVYNFFDLSRKIVRFSAFNLSRPLSFSWLYPPCPKNEDASLTRIVLGALKHPEKSKFY